MNNNGYIVSKTDDLAYYDFILFQIYLFNGILAILSSLSVIAFSDTESQSFWLSCRYNITDRVRFTSSLHRNEHTDYEVEDGVVLVRQSVIVLPVCALKNFLSELGFS